jgi:hypothetical protein
MALPGYGNYGDETQVEASRIDRNRKLAEALQQQAMSNGPAGQMAGGVFVPNSPLSGLAKALNMVNARKGMEYADQESTALSQRIQERRGADMSLLTHAIAGRQAAPAGLQEDAAGIHEMPAQAAQTPVQALSQAVPMLQDPQMQQMGLQATLGAQTREDNQAARLHERQLALQAQVEARRQQQAFMDQQARQAAQDRQALATTTAGLRMDQRQPVAVVGPDGKPVLVPADQAVGKQPYNAKSGSGLPPAALKMQNETLEEMGLAGSITSDLAALDQQLATGKLNVGPVRNVVNSARNYAGFSNEESQNYNSFRTTLEKLRNDSLRLNKGVQTEGDAQRAWNELMGNINDPAVVRKRLGEIQSINERAAGLKRLQLDTLRANFGADPLDVSQFTSQQTALGGGAQPAPTNVAGADPLGLRKRK